MRHPRPALSQRHGGGTSRRQKTDPDALKKITALESELLKLQAQIAMIVTAAPPSGTHLCFVSISFNKTRPFISAKCQKNQFY